MSDWKSVLYEYVNRKNRMELEESAETVLPLLTDENVFARQRARLERIKQRLQERQVKPINQEIRLKLGKISEQDRKVSVYIAMKKCFRYEIERKAHEEELVEYETVTMYYEDGHWRIGKIEEDIPEKRENRHSLLFDSSFDPYVDPNFRAKSIPLLNREMLPSSSVRAIPYRRERAQAYANRWWNGANPDYIEFEVDCTNFVSQCLFAGGAPMNYTGRRDSGWWYRGKSGGKEMWSFSWSIAHSLQKYLASSSSGLRSQEVNSPEQLDIGDVIVYDWDGDGRFQHNTIVTAIDARGLPLVNAHTVNSRYRYWDYRDSYAWSPNTVYRFFHIADFF